MTKESRDNFQDRIYRYITYQFQILNIKREFLSILFRNALF